MKKLNEDVKNEFELLQNEYIVNQKQVKGQLAIFARQRNYGIIFGISCLVLSIGIVFKSLSIAGEAKKIDKVVFKEDGTGGLTYIGMVNNTMQVNLKKYINNQLQEYVTALYSVPTDRDLRQHYVSKVQLMTNVNYYPIIQAIFKEEYTKNVSDVITIKINAIGEVSKGVWEIDWTQYKNSNNSGSWKSLITFNQVQDANDDVQIMQFNPLSIAVTNVNTSPRLISE